LNEVQDMTEARMPAASESSEARSVPRVRTLLVCDLADSTALVERLGDGAAADLIRKHDRVARDLLQKHAGREIDKTDGFLALFERPVQAVGFALDYQRALRSLGKEHQQPLRARVGIHIGEVVLWENSANDVSGGAKPVDVEGLAKPVAARLMALAMPGQILLSGIAYSLAQRAGNELAGAREVRWLTHGRYRFKGVPAPMLVHEVGESGFAPLHAPPSSAKAERDVPIWRKPGVLTLEAIALIAAIAVPFFLSLRAPPAIAFGERDWVVVGDLRNLTSEATLADSLETAFRISLEQSRYVNVLPDLKLRDSLARMQRAPGTEVDRAVASEIALREGARAVILPTVAEVGGRVRVSAEVIDPHTQTTVYAESADGVGAPSTLESIDVVTQELRARLGEAMQAIDKDSAPLPRITSGNLEALRAYALATQAQATTRGSDARALYQRALELDPEFALAHLGLARLEMGSNNRDAGIVHARRAGQLRERLTPRDALYADAWMANFGPPLTAMEKWKLLASLYPDYHAGGYNYALHASQYANDYEGAITALTPALAQQNPLRGAVYYTLGALLGAQEKFDEALAAFKASGDLGYTAAGELQAGTLVAMGREAEALQVLERAAHSGATGSELVLRERLPVALAMDHGDFSRAARLADAAGVRARPVRRVWADAFVLASVAARLRAGDAKAMESLRDLIESQVEAVAHADDLYLDQTAFGLALAAYVAASHDNAPLARRALGVAGELAWRPGYPNVAAMARVAQAEAMRAEGDAAAAAAMLEDSPAVEPLYLQHAARLRALRAADEPEDALREAEWLVAHRGRAWMEWGGQRMQVPLNVAESRVALLERAELQHALGHAEAARASLAAFDSAWPAPGPALQARAAALRAATGSRAGEAAVPSAK
jgi:putative peptide modification system cyclase